MDFRFRLLASRSPERLHLTRWGPRRPPRSPSPPLPTTRLSISTLPTSSGLAAVQGTAPTPRPRFYLAPDVGRLVAHGHPGDAREVYEGQIRDVRGADLQVDELLTDPQSFPSNDILGWERGKREKWNRASRGSTPYSKSSESPFYLRRLDKASTFLELKGNSKDHSVFSLPAARTVCRETERKHL